MTSSKKIALLLTAMSFAAPAAYAADYGHDSSRTAPASGYNNPQRHNGYSDNRYDNRNSNYSGTQRDPSYWSNTVSDCVHGSTGIASNQDCSRNHASRHSTDTSPNTTDTAYLNGSPAARNSAY